MLQPAPLRPPRPRAPLLGCDPGIRYWDPPTNLLESPAQINLHDAVKGVIEYKDPASGKEYKLAGKGAIMVMRPRG